MTATYRIALARPDGTKLKDLLTFSSLEYAKSINSKGTLTAKFPGNSADPALFSEDFRLSIWRGVDGRAEVLDMQQAWFITRVLSNVDADGQKIVEVGAESAVGLLGRRHVIYAPGAAQASVATYADNAIKRIVTENLGSGAGTGRTAMSPYIAVDVNMSRGFSVSKQISWRNVLQTAQELARDSEFNGIPIYFDLLPTSQSMMTLFTWIGQPGTNRSTADRSVLSIESGRLRTAQWGYDREISANVVYGLGQEFGGTRVVQPATDTAGEGATPFSRRETTLDARGAGLPAETLAEATAELGRRKPTTVVVAEIADIEEFRYGVDWFYGDRLTVRVENKRYACLVDSVSVSVSQQREQVKAVLRF